MERITLEATGCGRQFQFDSCVRIFMAWAAEQVLRPVKADSHGVTSDTEERVTQYMVCVKLEYKIVEFAYNALSAMFYTKFHRYTLYVDIIFDRILGINSSKITIFPYIVCSGDNFG